jgi:DNA-binding beta-propeller fold protein YncE
MSAKRVLERFRAPDELEAENRAWAAVRAAYQQRDAASGHRSVRRPFGIAAAALTIAGVGALSPAGATVGRLVGHAFQKSRAPGSSPAARASSPQALVTDEQQNRLLVVDLPSGRVVRSVPVPPDPEDIATSEHGGAVIVVSSRAGKVTILDRHTLKVIRTLSGFQQPHIAAISPDGSYAYITDDARGTLTVIRLGDLQITDTVAVGSAAHHLAFSPTERTVWVALGETAQQITTLTTVTSRRRPAATPVANPAKPHVVGHFAPGFPAHDLAFSPDGRSVWITSAVGADVTAFSARTHRMLFRVPVGAPPQHIVFEGPYAYLTSGYGSTIEKVRAATGKVITRASAPYGCFELDAADGYVVSSSLLRGTLAVYTPSLKLLRVVRLAPATREVAISRP